jgi:hypothetical protein
MRELTMSEFQQLSSVTLRQQPLSTLPASVDGGPPRLVERNIGSEFAADAYIFDREPLKHSKFDDISLSRSLRTQGFIFRAGNYFFEFRRDYVNYHRTLNLPFQSC